MLFRHLGQIQAEKYTPLSVGSKHREHRHVNPGEDRITACRLWVP
jgi:hypothetical protein